MNMPVKMKMKQTVARAQVGVSCKERYGVEPVLPAPPSAMAVCCCCCCLVLGGNLNSVEGERLIYIYSSIVGHWGLL
jgi:hypothetical protein